MKFILRSLALFFCLAYLTAFGTLHHSNAQSNACAAGDQPGAAAAQERDIVVLVNKARADLKLKPLTINVMLTAAAKRHSDDMAKNNRFDHTGSDGSTMDQRMQAAGFNGLGFGENILQRNDLSAAGAYDQWWNSPPHKANMLNGDFDVIGVAYTCRPDGAQYFYTMTLGTSDTSARPAAAPAQDAPQPDGTEQTEQ